MELQFHMVWFNHYIVRSHRGNDWRQVRQWEPFRVLARVNDEVCACLDNGDGCRQELVTVTRFHQGVEMTETRETLGPAQFDVDYTPSCDDAQCQYDKSRIRPVHRVLRMQSGVMVDAGQICGESSVGEKRDVVGGFEEHAPIGHIFLLRVVQAAATCYPDNATSSERTGTVKCDDVVRRA